MPLPTVRCCYVVLTALLAFDCATEHLSIALDVGGRLRSHEGVGGAQASAALLPAILSLLEDAGIGVRDLDAIAFGRGPGAFTGLRTACSVAQGLAFGAGKPVLPIDTLQAVAEDALGAAPDDAADVSVWALLDARMEQIYAARYQRVGGRTGVWHVLDAPMLTDAEALNRRWEAEPPRCVAGNALSAFGTRLRVGSALPFAGALPRAAAMLPLARTLWRRGGAVDAALALPLYLRDKVAQTTHEREAARGSVG